MRHAEPAGAAFQSLSELITCLPGTMDSSLKNVDLHAAALCIQILTTRRHAERLQAEEAQAQQQVSNVCSLVCNGTHQSTSGHGQVMKAGLLSSRDSSTATRVATISSLPYKGAHLLSWMRAVPEPGRLKGARLEQQLALHQRWPQRAYCLHSRVLLMPAHASRSQTLAAGKGMYR